MFLTHTLELLEQIRELAPNDLVRVIKVAAITRDALNQWLGGSPPAPLVAHPILWISTVDRHPPIHQRSIVRHPECGEFEATPCYGMHEPFWVPATADVFAPGIVTLPFTDTEWRHKEKPESSEDGS